MGDLSPIKILIVVVIALVVLGPEKLPDLTRRAGKAWSELRQFRDTMQSQVRDVIGDVPGLDELHDLPGLRSTFAGSFLSAPPRTETASTSPDPVGPSTASTASPSPGAEAATSTGTASDTDLDAGPPFVAVDAGLAGTLGASASGAGAWTQPAPAAPPAGRRSRPPSAPAGPVLSPDDPGLN